MNDRPPQSRHQITTLVDLLCDRGTGQYAARGFTFFGGDDADDEWLRYSELHRAAQRIALRLADAAARPAEDNGNSRPTTTPPRAIVLCPPGPSYLKALFGTLYSGVIAVTAYPPRARRSDERLDRVIDDSGSSIALVDQTIFDRRDQICKASPALKDLHWINVDDLPPDGRIDWIRPDIRPDALAILQYTSGSTSQPKGVCLTHRNLLSNLSMIYDAFEVENHHDLWSVTWLPPYHDMGLIGGLFQVMYAGKCTHVIPPASFVQKPIRWLRAIAKYGASVSGGPNFAYDSCVDRISQSERESLDLSSWTLAFTGAEPIRHKSLDRFAEAFAPCGFKRTSFFPCYGLAEATLIVSGGPRGRQPKIDKRRGDSAGLPAIPCSEIVSCGRIVAGQQVRIVDPNTLSVLPQSSVGEIWISGNNVSPGYWRRSDAPSEVFGQRLAGGSNEPFLRTGDLGYLDNGELYVTGRLKELIVIRGRNFQPADIEDAVALCSPLLVANASAAFEVETSGDVGLVIVQEVDRQNADELAEVVRLIRQRLVETFELEPHRIVLVAKRTIPKTSSGKVKRLETKHRYQQGELRELSIAGHASAAIHAEAKQAASQQKRDADEISQWLVRRLAKQLHVESSEIDVARPFIQYGLDSVSAVQIVSELESFLGRDIPATLFYDAPTITAVAERCCTAAGDPASPESATQRQPVSVLEDRRKDVAVVGIACRLPGSDDVQAFWRLLRAGRHVITDPPDGRADCVSDAATTRRAGWISNPDLFDAAMFGISPREARCMDPQHRLLLETSWRAIENAGIDPKRLAKTKTAAYVGISNRDYERLILTSRRELSTYSMTGNAASMAAHRLSYHLDLRGPSLAVDTACSSSLVALHHAIRAIQNKDCDSAIVAGVNLILSPQISETLTDAKMLSPDGLCKTFDADADGYVRGEGCVAMLLRPLADALRDGDPVHAVIRGTAINQDGSTNGITAPSGDSQTRLYREALTDAALRPADITLLEAHGTGTPLGDPIEARSLCQNYGAKSNSNPVCHLGAVKANVGHLEAASGLVSLLKVILELQHRETVLQPNLETLSPHIDLTDSRITIPANSASWVSDQPRIAAVSSFGFGGTNAHLIVSESRLESNAESARSSAPPFLVPLSASCNAALQETASDHANLINRCPDVDIGRIAAATAQQKTSHRHRLAIVGDSAESIQNRLSLFASGEASSAIQAGVAPTDHDLSIAFLFSGQGGQYAGMGRGLYRRSSVFRAWIDQCDELLEAEFGYRVGERIVSVPATGGSLADILEEPGSQTGLFVLQLALAKTLMSWGIHSTAVLGHSMGEYAAAAISEVMHWEDALRLTAIRAERVAQLDSNGAMIVVFDSIESVKRQLRDLDEALSVAAIDGPEHVVVSGPVGGIAKLERQMERRGTATRPLRIKRAFHSQLIDPVLNAIGETVSGFTLRSPNQTYISTLTGTIVSEELQTADYWMRHSRKPVQFAAALQTLGARTCDVAVEIGPHPTLCTLGQLNRHVPLVYRPTLVRGNDDWESILQTLAELFVRGADINWNELVPEELNRPRIILPGHPFDRKRFWIEGTSDSDSQPRSRTSHSTLTSEAVVKQIEERRRAGDADDADGAEHIKSTPRDELSRYAEAMPRVDTIVTKFMRHSLTALGIGLRTGDRIIPDEIVSQGQVHERHRELLKRICQILEEDGFLNRESSSQHNGQHDQSDAWTVALEPSTTPEDLAQEAARLESQYPVVRYELRLVSRCGQALPQVLRGDIEPLAILFPGGDTTDLERLYRASPIAKSSNRLVADAAAAVIGLQAQRTGRPRVLEIGAGTGGTTSFVLPAIAREIESYVFTDASPLLVADASRRFGVGGNVEYQVLDIESPANRQGIDLHSFDLVVAANVLHATKDLRSSLSHTLSLLRPGGFLIALEGVRRERFLDLVFGLTEGWWRFEDTDLRPAYPLIDEQHWTELLKSCGYIQPQGLPFPEGEQQAGRCQSVLIAGRGGVQSDRESDRELTPGSGAVPRTKFKPSEATPETLPWIEAFRNSTGSQQTEALEGYFRQTVSAILGHEPEQLDLDQPASNLGIDSLMAIQLKNGLETDIGLSVPMIAFLQGKSIRQLIEVAIGSRDPDQAASSKAQPMTDQRPSQDPSSDGAVPIAGSAPGSSSDVEKSDSSVSVGYDPNTGERVLGPMSVGQLALWMIHQRAPAGPAYNFAFAARTSGVVDHEAMTKACRSLVKRHPVLRTRYRLDGDTPVRVLSSSTDVVIDEKDCRDWKEHRVIEWIRREADRPFDLERGPVIRFSLLRCKAGDVLSIAMHHIAADLWSMDVLMQELIDLYAMIVGGGSIELGPLPTTYDAYVQWEQELDHGEEGARLWEYWHKKLEGAPHVLSLPTTYPRPPEQTFNGQSLEWTLPPEVVDALREVAHSERTTMFTIVLAAYQVFLARICGQDDLLVGTISASRGRSDWEGIVGYFLNQLVLRTRIVGSPTFRDVLRDSQREVLDALENQAFPFAKLVEKIRPLRDASRSPLVQTMFIWDKPRHLKESHFAPGKSSDRLRLKPLLMEQRGAPFDLTLIVFELDEELKLIFRYNTDLFAPDAIETLSESLESFIEAIARDPDTPVRSTPLLPSDQDEQLAAWNATDTDFDPRLSSYALFHQWVAKTPSAVAIESISESLNYAEADQRASWIAAQLRDQGAGPGDVVGLLMPRGVDAVVGILGIWRAGAAYVPLEPDHPTARLQAICDDASPSVVLTSGDLTDHRSLNPGCPALNLADCSAPDSNSLTDRDPVQVDPESPAYIIYTSGSTGRPKGVVLAHRGIANLAVAQHQTFGVVPTDRCLQFASLSFDASVFELIMAFHAGASLLVMESGMVRSTTTEIAEEIRRSGVSIATLPPSLLAAIPAENLPALHTVISAGEACSATVVKKWGDGRRMFNAYGPTEATVWATTELCQLDGKDPSLGQPITNVHAYVVDASLEPTPVGVPGELCLAGPGLAIEYKNLPYETSNAFVPNPFDDRFDATMYRTGDRARWTHDGKLEFLGRIDDQVKIDGNRIEPGEIAAVIRQSAGIENAHVVAMDSPSGQNLIAYIVLDRQANVDQQSPTASVSTIRRQLTSRLPCYMVPSQFIPVDQLPLTVNGKVDASKLPKPTNTQRLRETTATEATTKTEADLVEIWRDVLRLDELGIHDNFFDLGGASLQALQAADLATKRGYSISAERMFQFQTIAELAREIDATTTGGADTSQLDSFDSGTKSTTQPSTAERPVCQAANRSLDRIAPVKELKMVVESVGMYLPPDELTTSEVVQGCRNRLDFPLERMTGITSRHVAGKDEFSIDLARKAALDCLEHSRLDAGQIDLLIASNISRYDGPNFEISYEPSTASKLKHQIGATSALALDVCNACAGFFTALAIAQSKLLTGESRRAMIVSGEYITHLTKTAQVEIDGFLDPRLACLTLGDAGVAVIVELTDEGSGFETLDLYTAGRHHELCVAKATDQPHGGAIMLTDAIQASAVTLDHSVSHAHRVLQSHHWSPSDVRHLIMHQTSSTTLDGAVEELNRHFGSQIGDSEIAVNNLKHRGNTASTTHWVAVMDLIRQGRIKAGDKAVFAISGSGQTIGTALYQFDDLPNRIKDPAKTTQLPRSIRVQPQTRCGVRIASAATHRPDGDSAGPGARFSDLFVVEAASRAALSCLAAANWDPSDVELLVHAGIYRDDFLSEPAVAAIVAGQLKMNDDRPSEKSKRTLAFDLSDAGRGALTACSVIAAMIRSGQVSRAVVTASEIENNRQGETLRGIDAMGSALALERTDNSQLGFGEFFFRSYPQFATKLSASTTLRGGRPVLVVRRSSDIDEVLIRCVGDCVRDFLTVHETSIDCYDRVLVSLPSSIRPSVVGQAIGVSVDRVLLPHATQGDAFTSGIAAMWEHVSRSERMSDGQKWLMVSAGAGIEVACVEYQC